VEEFLIENHPDEFGPKKEKENQEICVILEDSLTVKMLSVYRATIEAIDQNDGPGTWVKRSQGLVTEILRTSDAVSIHDVKATLKDLATKGRYHRRTNEEHTVGLLLRKFEGRWELRIN
jgi:hypothetical protein